MLNPAASDEKAAFSQESEIADLISSVMSDAAQVTVIASDSEELEIFICGATDEDLQSLRDAFEDGTFRGTILDGAAVDAVGYFESVDCANPPPEIFSSTSDDLSNSYQQESESTSSQLIVLLPLFSFFVFALI